VTVYATWTHAAPSPKAPADYGFTPLALITGIAGNWKATRAKMLAAMADPLLQGAALNLEKINLPDGTPLGAIRDMVAECPNIADLLREGKKAHGFEGTVYGPAIRW
jgi:hypothetical protein